MTNSGGGDPTEPLSPVSGSELGAANAIDAVGEAPKTDEIGAAAPVGGPEGVDAPTPTDAIAQALAAGEIDADQARAQLIDAAVAAQLPPDVDPAVAADLRAEVAAALAADPTLERLLTP
jgi:hypothetical protein